MTDERNEISREEYEEAFDQLRNIFENAMSIFDQLTSDSVEPLEESAKDDSAIKNYATLFMEHIMKRKYCTSDRSYNAWYTQMMNHFDGLRNAVGVNTKGFSNKFKTLSNDMQGCYEDAIKAYMLELDDEGMYYEDLPDIPGVVPEKCPWSAAELIDDTELHGSTKENKNECFVDLVNRLMKKLPKYDESKVDLRATLQLVKMRWKKSAEIQKKAGKK